MSLRSDKMPSRFCLLNISCLTFGSTLFGSSGCFPSRKWPRKPWFNIRAVDRFGPTITSVKTFEPCLKYFGNLSISALSISIKAKFGCDVVAVDVAKDKRVFPSSVSAWRAAGYAARSILSLCGEQCRLHATCAGSHPFLSLIAVAHGPSSIIILARCGEMLL